MHRCSQRWEPGFAGARGLKWRRTKRGRRGEAGAGKGKDSSNMIEEMSLIGVTQPLRKEKCVVQQCYKCL